VANIEDIPLMIIDDMCTNRKSSPYGRAFLPSEGEWVFYFSMVLALPLLYGNNVIRNIQQVTTDGDRQIYNPLDILSKMNAPFLSARTSLLLVFISSTNRSASSSFDFVAGTHRSASRTSQSSPLSSIGSMAKMAASHTAK
jgi:hypothetical protein